MEKEMDYEPHHEHILAEAVWTMGLQAQKPEGNCYGFPSTYLNTIIFTSFLR